MELKEIRSLLALAEMGGLTAAGMRLGLTPAAIHKHLATLEEALGIKLYERRGGRLELTAAAHGIIPAARESLSNFEAMVTAAHEWRGLRRGLVRLGTGPAQSSYLLPGLLKSFHQQHPEIEFSVRTGNVPRLLEGISAGDLDVALIVNGAALGAATDAQIEASWDMEMVLVGCGQSLPKQTSLRELSHHPFLLFDYGMQLQSLVDSFLAGHGCQPRVAMRLDNPGAMKAMVKQGFGLAVMALWSVDEDIRAGKLQMVSLAEGSLLCKLALVRRKGHRLSEPAEAFLQLTKDHQFRNPRMTLES
jgi:DNA-binding transcriptional LysR family regulator